MATKVDCKRIARLIKDGTFDMVLRYKEATGHIPHLVTFIANNDPTSKRYVRNKTRTCDDCGILHEEMVFNSDTPEAEIEWWIDYYNQSMLVSGLMLQLPVFEGINADNLIQMIDPRKDVDCLTAENMGRLALGTGDIMPATVYGIMRLFKEEEYDLKGKTVVIRGRSNIVGKPLALAMINAGATVLSENSYSSEWEEELLNNENAINVVVDATGVSQENSSYGDVWADYYIDVTTIVGEDGKLHGSIEPDCIIAHNYTPVPGGVGLLTCAACAWNVAKLACLQAGIEVDCAE